MDNKDTEWMMNEHWKIINGGGIQISNTPEQLWEQATKYFKWCEANPIKAKRTLTSGKTQGSKVEIEYVRPYTIKGLCLHCGVSERWLNDIKDSHDKGSLWYVTVEKILMLIYNQVLEGAVVDLYNPIMVSKMLNMDKDSNEANTTVKIEFVQSPSNRLSNSENEILKNLDSEKINILKDKTENLER